MRWYFTSVCFVFALLTLNAQVFVNQTATGINDGTSWVNAFTDLQQAIDAAAPGAQIWISAGTYIPEGPTPDSSHFLILKACEIYGGFAGTETNLDHRDLETNHTILSGDILGDDVTGDFQNHRTDNAHHVLILNAPLGQTIIDGLIFQGGMTRTDAFAPDATDIPYHRWRGGGLYIYKSLNTVRNCVFRDNYGHQGSGYYAIGDTSQFINLALENSTFEYNSCTVAGACWIAGWDSANVTNCFFRNNNAGSFSAAMALGNSNVYMEDCLFEYNSSVNEAGACMIFNNASSLIPHPVYNFFHCGFNGNSAPSGGALRLNNFVSSFSLLLDSCVFLQNIATGSFGSGGALYVVDNVDQNTGELPSRVRIDRTIFSGNSATYGGAVEIDCGDDSLRIEVSKSGFFNNTGNDSGGGLYCWMVETSKVHTQIEQSTFDGNTARVGGGLVLDSYYNVDRMSYVIDSCNFSNNIVELYGGAIGQFRTEGPGLIGTIRNSQFLNNQAKQAGAMISRQETLQIENCLFNGNYAEGFDQDIVGGGGLLFVGPADINVRNSIFENNRTDVEGSVAISTTGVNARYENALFRDNQGLSTLVNDGSLQLVNATMANNEYGLLLLDSSMTEIQNSVFSNSSDNLRTDGIPEVISKGSNVSSDATMVSVLAGNGNFEDIHNTDPLLGPDLVPLSGSPCIDAGNPQGIKFPFDLAGNPRIHGNGIDIGAYESFLVATHDAEWNTTSFTVYPNPVKEVLQFELDTEWTGDGYMTIYNYAGQPVHRTQIAKSAAKQTFSESIRHLAAGEYVVLLDMGVTTYATKIIVQP